MEHVLVVENLRTQFDTDRGVLNALDGVSFKVRSGEIFGLAGESGCGKTMTAYSIVRLVPPPGKVTEGSVTFAGEDLLSISESSLRRIRGKEIALVFQEPSSALNPCFKAGDQIAETLRVHGLASSKEAAKKSIEILGQVGIPEPEKIVHFYPHQLSGGMKQRVAIAIAIVCEPRLLIADEPTTALDVTIQAQVLSLIGKMVRRRDMSMLYITHDLGVLRWICNRAAVMYAGRIVEIGPVADLISQPLHPYTIGLLRATPKMRPSEQPLETIKGNVPDLARLPRGCKFAPRCPQVMDRCREEEPIIFKAGEDHLVRCFLHRSAGTAG